ncbi:MAG: peptidylprolyl isomerase [Rhodospirillaceae bacterium]|nr:peptidylprolyl isomerase [Rhodospirillaceae bacterium]
MTLRTMLIASVCAISLSAGTAAAQDDDWVVATVGDHEIRLSEVQAVIGGLPPQYQQLPPQILVPSIAEQIAVGRIMQDLAYEEGLQDDPEVQERVAEAEHEIVQDVWLNRAVDAEVTDERLQEAYDTFLEENPPTEETHARHILVDNAEEAQEIIDQLDAGGDFVELAQEHSIGPSGDNGGDLGYFTRDQVVPEFADVAFELEPGSYTETPVETEFGFHVIQVEDRREVQPPAFEEVQDQLTQQVRQDIMRDLVADLREGADIVLYGPDGNPLQGPEDEVTDEAPAEDEATVEDAPAEDEAAEDAPAEPAEDGAPAEDAPAETNQ